MLASLYIKTGGRRGGGYIPGIFFVHLEQLGAVAPRGSIPGTLSPIYTCSSIRHVLDERHCTLNPIDLYMVPYITMIQR